MDACSYDESLLLNPSFSFAAMDRWVGVTTCQKAPRGRVAGDRWRLALSQGGRGGRGGGSEARGWEAECSMQGMGGWVCSSGVLEEE